MAEETSTIRVPRDTRDALADHARDLGISMAALLTEIARVYRRERALASERDASAADSRNASYQEELAEWDGTLADGLD